METVLTDNGSEFHSAALRDALLTLGIAIEFSKSRSPNDKPHVERFLKTLNYSFIHRLPGTTKARVADRKGVDAMKEAVLTLAELDRLIHVWIVSKYHFRPHGGLAGRAPITVWREGARAHPPLLKADRLDVDIEFSEVASRTIQHYGIDLNNFRYTSPELQMLRRLLKPKQCVDVKWPAGDAGHIYVFDPHEERWVDVPNKDPQYSGLTVDQAKQALKAAAAGDPDYKYMGAEASELIRKMVDDARKSRALKGRKAAERLANSSSSDARQAPEAQVPKSEPVDLAAQMAAMPVAASWTHDADAREAESTEGDAK